MLDEMLEVLANKHRRQLLVALSVSNSEVQTPESAQIDGEKLTDLQVKMYHSHLPKLEDIGYINWNQEKHTITEGPDFEQIEPVIEMFEENADELPIDWP